MGGKKLDLDLAGWKARYTKENSDGCWIWMMATYKATGLPLYSEKGTHIPPIRKAIHLLTGKEEPYTTQVCRCSLNDLCVSPHHATINKGVGYFQRPPKAETDPLKYIEERIIKLDSGCWEWKNKTNRQSYGSAYFGGNVYLAHRLSYMAYNDDWNLEHYELVCHHCDNPPCVNPAHLFKGTPKQNAKDMISKGRSKRKPNKRLTDCVVILLSNGFSLQEIASTTEITYSTALKIKNRKGL